MTIRNRLQNAVERKTPVRRGVVASVTTSSIFVSSPVGLKEFQVVSPSTFTVGDTVKFQGNVYLGRLPPASTSKIVNV